MMRTRGTEWTIGGAEPVMRIVLEEVMEVLDGRAWGTGCMCRWLVVVEHGLGS